MSTYLVLRDRALRQASAYGQTEAQTVAQIALEEAMKFVAFNVRVPSLIAKATATAPASPTLEANAIGLTSVGGFNISASTYQCPDRLYVKKDSSTVEIGTPYEVLEYHVFQDLKNIPSGNRIGVDSYGIFDERPQYSYTITPDGALWAQPLTVSNVLTLFYRIQPAAYADGSTPEILPLFDYILVKAAVLAVKEFLREPAEVTDMWTMFEGALMEDVKRYDQHLQGQHRRTTLKIHRSYRIDY